MWFSSYRPDRPRRRVTHGTVVAYVALLVAVLGIPATAVAATALVHTKNIAKGAVTNPKLAERSVGTQKIMDNAVTGAKVAKNTLTGRNIDESTLNLTGVGVTGIVHRVSGSGSVTVGDGEANQVVYPLTQGNPYQQPAHTADLYFGTFRVRFPAGCTGERWAAVDLFIRGSGVVGGGTANDQGTGQENTETGVFDTSVNFAETAAQRTLRAEVFGGCGKQGEPLPQVLSVTIHVGRIQ